ncbi:MAG: tetratricopeptide repeat protein [Symploca sp. SIO2D2]|nr:tetratricopeptide repeat protein [Symploca sp. SIO2D2]
MRNLHRQVQDLMGVAKLADAFTQKEQQFEAAIFELSQTSVAGKEINPEEARKITNWFQRFIWLTPTGITTTSSKSKSWDISGSGFAALTAIADDTEGLQEWIQQRVRHHPATKDKPQLQALMLEPVAQLTQAFAESLVQFAQSREQPLVLVLDTYERAQSYLNQWLWQYLVEDTPLASAPVRLVVVGRQKLQADEGWRKLHQDRQLLYETQLIRFIKEQTKNYLKQIGIEKGATLDKINKVTQGLPYYLNWVREQRDKGKELDFSQGNQAIAKLLLQDIDVQQRKILLVVACCRWFNAEILRYLLENDSFLGSQEDAERVEVYFEWLENSDFVELSQDCYRLEDVARDVFRQSYVKDYRNQFRHTNALLADYFKQQADDLFAPQTLLPDPYEDEEWREHIAEFLYYSLFGKGREGLQQYIEQVFVAAFLREPAVFGAPLAFIRAEMSEENRNLLPKATSKLLEDAGIVLRFDWRFIGQSPKSYKIKFEGENTPSKEKIEASIQSLLGHVGYLEDCFGKSVGLLCKALRCNRLREMADSLLPVKRQAEQVSAHCRPQVAHSLFFSLGNLLISAESYEDSLDCYQKAIDLNPQSVDAWVNRAYALINLERYEEALESSQTAIDLEPQSVNGWANRAEALDSLERYKEALESFQQAIDLEPQSVNGWANRGHTLRNLQQYEEALSACEQALKIDPQEPESLSCQALILSFLNDFEQAIAVIDQAITLKPQQVVYKANRGIILARAGRYTEAIANCEQAIKQDPKHESGYYGKACCYALQGEIEPAINNLQKAIEIKPRLSRREAKSNPDFDSIRDEPRFRELMDNG